MKINVEKKEQSQWRICMESIITIFNLKTWFIHIYEIQRSIVQLLGGHILKRMIEMVQSYLFVHGLSPSYMGYMNSK